MGQQLINLGTAANDGTGDTARAVGAKLNAMFGDTYPRLRAANNRCLGLGDSRINRGLLYGPNASVKDRGLPTDGLQFWLQTLSKGRIVFEEADQFAVNGSNTASLAGATTSPANQGMLDYQLPLALQSTAAFALVLSSTNDRGTGAGAAFTSAQSIANILGTVSGLVAAGKIPIVVAEYPKGNASLASPTFIDYGLASASYAAVGSGHVRGDILTMTKSGLTPIGGRYPKLLVNYASGGGVYGVTVVDPGSYGASLSGSLTGWTQSATTGAGTGFTCGIAAGLGGLTQGHLRVRDWIVNTLPGLFPCIVVDPWPVLVAGPDSNAINLALTADGVHLNSSGNYLVAKLILAAISTILPPVPTRVSSGFMGYDQTDNAKGNLVPPFGSLTAALQSGTASVLNTNTASAAATQPAVTGNTPPNVLVGIDNNLMAATSPTVTLSHVTTATGDWLQVALTGTTGPNGGIISVLPPSNNGNAAGLPGIYALMAAGDQVRAECEFELDPSTAFYGLSLQFGETNTSSAAYNRSWAGLLNSVGAAPGLGVYGTVWDSLFGGQMMTGLLRTTLVPILAQANKALYFQVQAAMAPNLAYSTTFRLRNWGMFKA